MRVKTKTNEDGTIRLSVTATAQEVNEAFDKAEAAIASRFGLKPNPAVSARDALAEHLGVNDVDSILQAQALNMLVPYALDQKNIVPLVQPKVEPTPAFNRKNPYAFQIDVTPKPVFKLSSYDPVEITVPAYEPQEIDVDAEILANTNMYTEFETADPHPVQPGDHCLIALEVSQDGERLNALSTESRVYSTGRGYMPESFDKQIIGMDVGETKSFSFEGEGFDEDGNKVMRSYDCTVTVKEIKKEVKPELTDEWVKRMMPMYDSVDELRREIRASYETQMLHQHELQVMSIAQTALAERLEGNIPDEAYEATANSIEMTLRNQLSQQGKDIDEFIQEQGGEQNYRIGIMMQARQTLKCDYALDALFDHENLSITEDDINSACSDLNPMNPQAVRAEMESSGRGFALREVAARYAASRYLVEHAKITVAD